MRLWGLDNNFDKTNFDSFKNTGPTKKINTAFKKIRKDQLKRIDDLLKGIEPYDLSEIRKIAQKTTEIISNVNNSETKKGHLYSALEKINLIFANHNYLLNRDGGIDEMPDLDEIRIAENIKKQIEIQIHELTFTEFDATNNLHVSQPHVIRHDEKNPEPFPLDAQSNSTKKDDETVGFKQNDNEDRMSVKDVAKYLYRSERTIRQWIKDEKIPYHRYDWKIDFSRAEIDEWDKAGRPKNQIATISASISGEKKEYKYLFSFNVDLLPLAKKFAEKGYLTEENAILFASRFKSGYLKDNLPQKIEWEKRMKSLMTFILVADKLGWIKFDEGDRREIKLLKESHIPMEPFYSNFNIKKGGISETAIFNNRELVVNGLAVIKNKTQSLINIKEPTFYDILDSFFANQLIGKISNSAKKYLDWEILRDIWEHHKKYIIETL